MTDRRKSKQKRRGGHAAGAADARFSPEKAKEKQLGKASRRMIMILRHRAEDYGLKLGGDGYMLLDDLLACDGMKDYKISLADVKTIVATCNKQRFGLKEVDGVHHIRANQGHSISSVKTEDLLEEIRNPDDFPNCVHGTYWKGWNVIKTKGLHKMGRLHIHFAPGEKITGPNKVISGMRSSAQVYIYLDLAAAMNDGIRFFKSSNEVILTEGDDGWIRPKYFKKVISSDGQHLITFHGEDASHDTVDEEKKELDEASLVKDTFFKVKGLKGLDITVTGANHVRVSGEIIGKKSKKRFNRLKEELGERFPNVKIDYDVI